MAGEFIAFNGLWARGHVDTFPPDHFSDCSNLIFTESGFRHRDGYSQYNAITGVVRMHLYKPNPPFTGTNVPRIIALKSNGALVDVLLGTTLHTDALWLDFALVNFFGRCYISPHDGKVGIENEDLYVYDGTNFRLAAGVRPTNPLSITPSVGTGTLGIGTYVISYAWESSTGFITQPAPFNYMDSFGQYRADLTNIAIGPSDTVARWIIVSKLVPDFGVPTFRANLAAVFDDSDEAVQTIPIYYVHRIEDNVTTAYNLSFYDENLRDSADYLWTQRSTIPAGVGLLDFRGRLITYGIFEDPSLVLASQIGEPEAHSETSGFFITDPADSTGVRSATEFRDTLYVFKRQRGYMTQDNGEEASTWQVIHFEKSIGTEQYGVAAVLDAKGASSDGFLVASVGGIYYFNGIFVEPELTYKIRDYWSRINENFFYRVQVALDPINKRIYILAPLDDSESVSHIIFGDYREGLTPRTIKWSPWILETDPTSILVYTDFTGDEPSLVTRISNPGKITTLSIDSPSTDDGVAAPSLVKFPPFRYGTGISQFSRIRLRATGTETYNFIAYGTDELEQVIPQSITVPLSNPGQEFLRKFNLVSEMCTLQVNMTGLNFKVMALLVEGIPLWDERPQ